MRLRLVLVMAFVLSLFSALTAVTNAAVIVDDNCVALDFCEYDGDSALPFGKGANADCYYPIGDDTPYIFPEVYTWSGGTVSETSEGAMLRATRVGAAVSMTVDKMPVMYRQVVQTEYRYFVLRIKTNAAAEGTVTFSSLGNTYRRVYPVSFTGKWQTVTLDLSGVDGWSARQSDGSYKAMSTAPWDSRYFAADGFAVSFSSFAENVTSEIILDYIAYSTLPDIHIKTGKPASYSPYIEGGTDGLFRPNDCLTRRDAAIIVARLVGESQEGVDAECRFTDVADNDYGIESILLLDSLGILSRYGDKFLPDSYITVSELSAMLVNARLCEKEMLATVLFENVTESAVITRAEACALINSVTERSVGYISDTTDFDDVSPVHPLCGEVLVASRSSDVMVSRDGTVTVVSTYDEPNYDETDAVLSEIDKSAKALYDSIHNSKTEIVPSGKCYYVSPKGNDSNSGTSPDSPWKSLAKVNAYGFSAGTVVYFERGGLWRGSVRLLPNVTYTAYGEGDKPTIYGSPYDGADESLWTLVEGTDNIWRFKHDMLDCGSVVFNHGEAHSYKETPSYNGTTYLHRNSSRVFDYKTDISRDLGIFCDNKRELTKECALYLRCDAGNPGALYDSIEFLPRQNIISVVASKNATVDNLRFMYTGAHAIGAGTLSGFTVTNCEFLWIGGSIQNYNAGGGTMAVRYGNAVESYGAPSGYTVENCYIHQVYDAGITHQMSGGTQANGVQKDIRYANNLIEYCSYSIEYFLGDGEEGTPDRYMENVVIEDNIMRFAGFGFGNQRTDRICMSHIKSGNTRNAVVGDFIIRNNIFDRSREMLFFIGATDKAHLPTLSGNTYIQYLTERSTPYSTLGKYGAHPARLRFFEKDTESFIVNTLDADATVLIAKPDRLFDLPEY